MNLKRLESLSEVYQSIDVGNKKGWRRLLAFLGPAYLISVGYMDPGNWAADIAGGSQFGYKLIWVLLMSNLVALLLQSLCARLGVVRGMDLAQASRYYYSKWVNFPLFILAQTAIIACDLAEIIGVAIGLQLIFDLPLQWGVSITLLDTLLLLFLMNKGMRAMERFIISMVFIVGLSFLLEMFIVEPSFTSVLEGFKPSSLEGDALYIAIGIIGATVMPHNLYLHSSLVQTRKRPSDKKGIKEALRFNFIDTAVALNAAFFVNAAILILSAAAFFENGLHNVVEIQDAHNLLSNIFGDIAPMLFAVALIAAGQSSTLTGTLAGQIIMEGHINLRIEPWLRRLITRLLAIVPAFLTVLYFGGNALGQLLILSQVVLSLQLGFAIIPLIHFTSDKKYMKGFHIKTLIKILAWTSAFAIVYLNVKLVVDELSKWMKTGHWYINVIILPAVILVGLLLVYIFIQPMLRLKREKKVVMPHGEALNIGSIPPISYSKIGITVDFSDNDLNTINSALAQGGKDPEYYLIHIVETAAARYYGSSAMDMETKYDSTNLEKYKQNLTSLGYKSNMLIGFGNAPKAIAYICKANDIDLLVMGAHGHKGLKDLIFGTTVDAVRHRVNIPVFIIN